jgi:anti-anti-sigma factor
MISITSSRQGDIAVVHISGRIDGVTASEFETACQAAITAEVKFLVLDLGEVQYVSSMGLRSFVVIGKGLQERGGALRLARVTGPVAKVLKISGFHSLFSSFDSVESAIGS